jgi:Helicase conserved C-terminal domain
MEKELVGNWLTDRQLEAVNHVSKSIHMMGAAIVWWKIGEGKTRIALQTALSFFNPLDGPLCVLVICSPQAFRQWKDELAEMPIPDFKEALQLRFLSYGILSTNKGFAAIQTVLQEVKPDFIIVDELWLYKNPKSKRSKILHEITTRVSSIGLSGSLVTARNIEDLYGQAYAIGLDRLLARSLTHFRTQFCVAVEEFGLKFYAKKDALPAIQQRLAPTVDIHFPKSIRETRIQHIAVEPTREQSDHIYALINDYYTQFDRMSNEQDEKTVELEVKFTTALMVKLQQVSDGIVMLGEGETVSLAASKEQRLYSLLDEYIDAGEQVIVWFAFKASLDKIYQKLGKKATCLSSHHKFDASGWAKGNYNACLATIGSGASLNDFANCQHSIIYSAPNSPQKLEQALGRTNRTSSQQRVCHYQFLSTLETPDKLVYQNCRISAEVEKSIIRSSTEIILDYLNNQVNHAKTKTTV